MCLGRWASLRPRLLALVRMQRQWGQVHEIYEGLSASRFDHGDIPTFIRDPDSTFSAVWDLSQVFLLLYVAVTVPMRAGATTSDHNSPPANSAGS